MYNYIHLGVFISYLKKRQGLSCFGESPRIQSLITGLRTLLSRSEYQQYEI